MVKQGQSKGPGAGSGPEKGHGPEKLREHSPRSGELWTAGVASVTREVLVTMGQFCSSNTSNAPYSNKGWASARALGKAKGFS